MKWEHENYIISTDKNLLQIDRIHEYLSKESYWASSIPKEIVKKSTEESLCFGLYENVSGAFLQIGLARVITDKATFAWLSDVYVEEKYRGQGLSKWLMKVIVSHPELQNLRRFCLTTRDAHGLYKKIGFHPPKNPEYWMEIKADDLYLRMAKRNN